MSDVRHVPGDETRLPDRSHAMRRGGMRSSGPWRTRILCPSPRVRFVVHQSHVASDFTCLKLAHMAPLSREHGCRRRWVLKHTRPRHVAGCKGARGAPFDTEKWAPEPVRRVLCNTNTCTWAQACCAHASHAHGRTLVYAQTLSHVECRHRG
jgi:hypothetical protein